MGEVHKGRAEGGRRQSNDFQQEFHVSIDSLVSPCIITTDLIGTPCNEIPQVQVRIQTRPKPTNQPTKANMKTAAAAGHEDQSTLSLPTQPPLTPPTTTFSFVHDLWIDDAGTTASSGVLQGPHSCCGASEGTEGGWGRRGAHVEGGGRVWSHLVAVMDPPDD
ncbi:uncharacterized protein LOC143281993 [Babylonia areolata]|uniref:uncharacterized protein LOC143281993 n=1 Tax=Babylonia areolata TaxID=304850 RepID=UPI003FD42A4F